jgi:hypothetical protein
MAYYPATTFVPQFFTDAGVPLSGGTVTAYVAGTSTLTPMYIDLAGTSGGSTITLNARGEPQVSGNTVVIFLDSAISYKFVLKNASGTSMWTVDAISNVVTLLASSATATVGAGMVGFDGDNAYAAGTVGYALRYARPTVQMIKTALGVFKVFKPNGEEVDISASTTDGLQEAINEACTNGWDLYVAGGGVTTAGVYQTAITCTTGIVFPPMQTRRITIGSVSIEFSAAVTGDGVLIDSCMMVHTDWQGQIVYRGNNAAMRLKTNTAVPLDAVKVFDASTFHLPTIAIVGGTNADGIIFESVDGAIQRCLFTIPENNGADFATVYGRHGISILDPSGAGSGFIGNTIRCPGLHKFASSSLKIGSSASVTSIYGNTYDCCIMPDGASSIGVQTYGDNDTFHLSLLNNEGTLATGIQLESSAANNVFHVSKNDATTPVVDSSTDKSNTGMYGQILPRASVHRNGTNQTAVVTATWTKVAFTTEIYDNGSKFDPATNYRWTPQKIGQARISARAAWATMADASIMRIAIYKNGSAHKAVLEGSSGTLTGQGPEICATVNVDAVTDYFEIFVRQETGGDRDIDGATSDTWAMFEMLP